MVSNHWIIHGYNANFRTTSYSVCVLPIKVEAILRICILSQDIRSWPTEGHNWICSSASWIGSYIFQGFYKYEFLKSSLLSQASIGWSWVWQGLYDDGPSGLQNTWTLPRLHGLDNYSLGINLNWHGHKSGLDKISCSINFAHFSGVKNHFLFSYISHMSWFYILELFSVPKNTLFVSCFRAAYRHLAPRSVVLWAVSPQVSSGRLMHHW